MLLASSDFNEQQLQELQQQSPAAIGADGRFCTLKALSQEAKVDFANTKVRTAIRCARCTAVGQGLCARGHRLARVRSWARDFECQAHALSGCAAVGQRLCVRSCTLCQGAQQ